MGEHRVAALHVRAGEVDLHGDDLGRRVGQQVGGPGARRTSTRRPDTAAGALEDVSEALVLADYSVLVVRPTLLDLAGLARTVVLVRKLKKPCAVVMNQAPVPREGSEAPVVRRFLRGLEYMRVPVIPVVVRARTVYQTALETGRSAEESADEAAKAEITALWDFVWRDMAMVLGKEP